MSTIHLTLLPDETCHLSTSSWNREFCLCCPFHIAFLVLSSVVSCLHFSYDSKFPLWTLPETWFQISVCVYKFSSLNRWQKWLSLTNTHISGIVVKFGFFRRTSVFSMIKLKSDVTPFLQLLFKHCLQVSKLLESEKWSCLHHPRLCCCCLLCSSLTAACRNWFYFPFVVDKHDFEPSYRYMCTQKSLMDQGSSEQSPEEPDAGGQTEPEVSRRASESEHGLSKITHNALENMGALGHGLKHFFQPQRRRSSVSPHDSVSSCSGAPPSEPTDAGSEVGDAPASSVPSLDSDNPAASAPPAALSRVLQQIRGAPPMMKRGTSLQSRRSKAGAPGDPPQKGSPQIHRRSTHEALLQAGRPRSSSTTDTPSSPALADVLLASGYHSAEDPDKVSVLIPVGGPT